jgi:hypothetical protein
LDLRTSLLSGLLADFDEDYRLTVFDVGPALPETVDFFSQFRCRLYFADLYSDIFDADVLGQEKDETSADDLSKYFASQFDYPAETRFDICLFWDVLNYLDSPALLGFSRALNPFLSKNTGIHCFSTLKASIKLPNQQFSIKQPDCLNLRPREGMQAPCYPHPQIELNKCLYGMDVSKATLLSNGLLEMLMKVTSPPD